MDILSFPLLAHWPGTTPQHYLLSIGWQPSHREVKQLAQGYTISDEACSYSSFSHSQKKIGEELLRGRQGSMKPSLGHSTGLQDLYRPRQLREMGQQKSQSHPSVARSGSDSQ